jgi:hypothetical protein
MLCLNCGKEYYSKYHPNGRFCSRECCIKYWQKHYSAKYQRKRRQEIKEQVFKLLGGKCVKCGYVGVALQVDHVNGGGLKEITEHRKKGNSYTYWKMIFKKIKNGSKDYQLLCANCNWEKYYNEK